jgi:hypothetical protein
MDDDALLYIKEISSALNAAFPASLSKAARAFALALLFSVSLAGAALADETPPPWDPATGMVIPPKIGSPDTSAWPDKDHLINNPNLDGNATGIFNPDGNSGSAWIQLFRGNGGPAWIADPGASSSISGALRIALGLYSNALLIVAAVILLYHLLVMTTETAHQGVVGGKRANQLWSPIRLVIAVGLLVPLSSGLNSAQYISLEVVEWGSNMATKVWDLFLHHAGSGAGSNPTPHMPDVSSIAREAAKIGACMALINNYNEKSKGSDKDKVQMRSKGPAILYGTEKFESLCGSIIVFAMGPGAMAGVGEIQGIIQQMQQYAPHFIQGNQQFNQDPGQAPDMMISAALGTLESVAGGWNNAGGSAGSGWVSAGSYFLTLAAGGSNRVSGTDTLPIVMGPKSELIRPEQVQQAFYKMAEWIVGKYKKHASGGGADPDMIGNTVAGRKFVDLMLLFLDQMGVISGLWAPGSIAFYINLGNSPLAELVDLGHRMIRTALDFVGEAVELGVNEPQHAMYSSQVASDGSKSFGPKAGLFFAYMAVPILAAAAAALLNMGIMLGIFLPLLPFTKFVLSVMTWMLSLLEMLACVPLMALAWLTPYGEGFAGQKVEPGYFLIIHTFMRPVMTVFGMIASILLFNAAAYLVTTFYYAIASNAGTFSGGMYVVAKISFGMMYVSILYMCLNSALKAMDTLGRNAMTWMGGRAHEENLGEAQAAVQIAEKGTAMFSQGLSAMAHMSLSAGQMLAQGMGGQGGHHGPQGGAPSSGAPSGSNSLTPGQTQPGSNQMPTPLSRSEIGSDAPAGGTGGRNFAENGNAITGGRDSNTFNTASLALDKADTALGTANKNAITAGPKGDTGATGPKGSNGGVVT